MKVCRKCKRSLALHDFYKRKTGYILPCCKVCSSKAINGVYKPKTHDPLNPKVARRNYSKEIAREKHLNRSYGMTQVDYTLIELIQEGKCAICKEETTLVVDHDHTTGKVRGLLCSACNKGLGLFRDRVSFLLAAVNYLE